MRHAESSCIRACRCSTVYMHAYAYADVFMHGQVHVREPSYVVHVGIGAGVSVYSVHVYSVQYAVHSLRAFIFVHALCVHHIRDHAIESKRTTHHYHLRCR